MRTGVFWEEGSSFCSCEPATEEARCETASLKKVLSHVASIDKNNGLMLVIRVNKKPELMGQSVYN